MIYKPIEWLGNKVRILDQTKLPNELIFLDISDYINVGKTIKNLSVRGAPLLGITAAYAVVLAGWQVAENDRAGFFEQINTAINHLKSLRPTAKNLFWALERMRKVLMSNMDKRVEQIKQLLLKEALAIHHDDADRCLKIGRHGANLLHNPATVLTHCNTGALATGGIGTALGVIVTAVKDQKKAIKVFVDETRPLLQGARLTAWELVEENIDATLICDSMAAVLMQKKAIDLVIVGADRIARNGDTANKIGTFNLAVLAEKHRVPFYVAAPISTCDFDLATGAQIQIEERAAEEITEIGGMRLAPEEIKVFNPAFDVTPAELITGIITELGVITAPFEDNFKVKKIS